METELISIKGVFLIFWQNINSTVVLVYEIIDANICTSFMQMCDWFPQYVSSLLQPSPVTNKQGSKNLLWDTSP